MDVFLLVALSGVVAFALGYCWVTSPAVGILVGFSLSGVGLLTAYELAALTSLVALAGAWVLVWGVVGAVVAELGS